MVTNLTRQSPDGNPLIERSNPGAALGMDVKYALTPGLTFTGTVNPDFGQVEADPAIVNLTAFETFFSERRPFFVEGSGTFNFGLDCNDGACTGLFYSRRIGRSPQGTDDLPDGDGIYTDSPIYTSILGAGKLTGRVGRYSIGVMQAFTQEESRARAGRRRVDAHAGRAVDQLHGRPRAARVCEPVVNRRHAHRDEAQLRRAASRSCPTRRVTSGLDWDLRFKTRYSLTGYLVGSDVRGEPEAITRLQENSRHYFQRPDLTSASLDVDAHVAHRQRRQRRHQQDRRQVRPVQLERRRSSRPASTSTTSGSCGAPTSARMGNWLQIRSDTPTRWFRSRNINFNQYATWNFDGDRLFSGGNVNAHATFVNNWEIGGGYNFSADRIRRSRHARRPGRLLGRLQDALALPRAPTRRRALQLNYFIGGGSNGEGTTFAEFEPEPDVPPAAGADDQPGHPHLEQHVRARSGWRTSPMPADHYVFGELDQKTVAMTMRLNYTMTPTLSLQLYARAVRVGRRLQRASRSW